MLELNGKIEKIEKSNITNIELVIIHTEKDDVTLELEIVKRINPFKLATPVTVRFDKTPIAKGEFKMVMNGFIQAIKKLEGRKKILINIGGLRLTILAPESFNDFKLKSDIVVHFS